jgi:hypothetical protein
VHDYADVVIHVNGTMEYSEYEVQVAKDGGSILFVCTIHARSFDKKILKTIMMIITRAALALLPETARCKIWNQRRCIPRTDFSGASHR